MFTKQSKMPPITNDTKLLSFDLESNGLHGDVFSAAGVVLDATGKVHGEFLGRCKLSGPVDPWVEKNVIPAIKDVPIMYDSYKALREAFWRWFVVAQETADYVLVSNGYPVEYRFLLKCQEDDLDERYWQHPFPIIDLTSMLLLQDQESRKNKQVATVVREGGFTRHHPLNDAKITALTAFKVFESHTS